MKLFAPLSFHVQRRRQYLKILPSEGRCQSCFHRTRTARGGNPERPSSAGIVWRTTRSEGRQRRQRQRQNLSRASSLMLSMHGKVPQMCSKVKTTKEKQNTKELCRFSKDCLLVLEWLRFQSFLVYTSHMPFDLELCPLGLLFCSWSLLAYTTCQQTTRSNRRRWQRRKR